MIGFLNSIIDPLKKNRYISLSMRKLLFPLAWIYGLLLLIRHTLFDLKLLSQKRVAIKTLGVGNLALGGTGKSVVVDYLLEQFKKTTHLAVLSRGYKRKTKGYIQAQQNVTAALIGDEPFQFHKKHPEVIVAVCEKRVVGIQHLMALEKGPSVVILDDVMQHRWLVIDKLIMTTTYDNLYSSDALFPVGALRDRKKEAQRAATAAKYANGLSSLKQIAAEADRNPESLDLGFWSNWDHEVKDRKTPQEGERHIMTGGSDAIEDDINAMRDLGVEIFMFQLAKPESLEATLASMDRFSDQILSKF